MNLLPFPEQNAGPIHHQVRELYEFGSFVTSIRYYRYKINLYLLRGKYLEVFVNHKKGIIEKILPLDTANSRMKFYCDQIRIQL
ncbi:MAG: hypothetical protein FJZ78_00270 [Bacteroidetes bacterium]|nr:hypothetical protein [Bacteroidota bacterium]